MLHTSFTYNSSINVNWSKPMTSSIEYVAKQEEAEVALLILEELRKV